ncbi:uncharacterized protein LOC141680049 [Apium graveolens]|uniref:uncharacterized protein LOC141680049 n=1 Tax=Apium graveolens TaxID=4045 RepID=UPI003D7946BC
MATSNIGVLESRGRNREIVDFIFRVGSLNVGTLTGKFLDFVDGLKKRHVDAVCAQETKRKGVKTKEANGFKLWYSGVVTNKNGVDDLVSTIPSDQILYIGGDFNGHIGEHSDGYVGTRGVFGYGIWNESGCTLLEFALAHELVINHLASLIRGVDKDMLGIILGKIHDQKEAWWWNEDVQERIKAKQARFKELICCNEQKKFDTKKTLYKEAKWLAKRVVVEAKDKAYEEIYRSIYK